MATTIPCVLRDLGNRNPDGFTKAEILIAFVNEGYNPEKAERRYRQIIAANQITQIPDSNSWVTVYSYVHQKLYTDILKDIQIRAVKIARDGSIVYL